MSGVATQVRERPILMPRSVRGILEGREAEVQALFEEGCTAAEMAEHFGCSTYPVKRVLGALGLRRPACRRKGLWVGPQNPAWKGGRRVRKDGYVVVWTPEGERLEHRVVMEQHLGRSLRPGEIVHHRDQDKANNRPSNLEVMTQSEHARLHSPQMHKARYGHA